MPGRSLNVPCLRAVNGPALSAVTSSHCGAWGAARGQPQSPLRLVYQALASQLVRDGRQLSLCRGCYGGLVPLHRLLRVSACRLSRQGASGRLLFCDGPEASPNLDNLAGLRTDKAGRPEEQGAGWVSALGHATWNWQPDKSRGTADERKG